MKERRKGVMGKNEVREKGREEGKTEVKEFGGKERRKERIADFLDDSPFI